MWPRHRFRLKRSTSSKWRSKIGGYEAWMVVKNKEVKHYGILYEIEVNEKTKVATCWIASTVGKVMWSSTLALCFLLKNEGSDSDGNDWILRRYSVGRLDPKTCAWDLHTALKFGQLSASRKGNSESHSRSTHLQIRIWVIPRLATSRCQPPCGKSRKVSWSWRFLTSVIGWRPQLLHGLGRLDF